MPYAHTSHTRAVPISALFASPSSIARDCLATIWKVAERSRKFFSEKEAEAARAAAEKARREVDAARQDSPEPQRDELQRIDELREKKAAKDKKRAEEERANVNLKLVRPPSEHVLPTHQGLVTPGIDTPDATSDAEEEAAPADEDTLIPLGKGLRI